VNQREQLARDSHGGHSNNQALPALASSPRADVLKRAQQLAKCKTSGRLWPDLGAVAGSDSVSPQHALDDKARLHVRQLVSPRGDGPPPQTF